MGTYLLFEGNSFFSMGGFSFWTLLPLLLCVGIIIFLLRISMKLSTRIEKRKEEIRKLSEAIANKTTGGSKGLPVYSADVENIVMNSNVIQSLSDDIAALKKQLANAKPKTANTPEATPQPAAQEITKEEIFYMTKPVENYFPNSAKSARKEDTVYRFTIKGKGNEAEYEVHTLGAPVDEIAKRNETYLKPACDEENLPGASVKNIVTQKPGTALLEGDKWVIKTKALIRYE